MKKPNLKKVLVFVVLWLMSCTQGENNASKINKSREPKMKVEKKMKANALINEKSPYLLQHAYNPVNWVPWGKQAFEKAKSENKLIFLSIGYSTCHWCHVMEKESFEKDDVAALLNKDYISIKVDREERPDVDNVYMGLAQAIGAGGGWPLNLFLTPDRIPFTGGTYFPPESKYGRPGFKEILTTIANQWKQEQGQINSFTEKVKQHISQQKASGSVSLDLKAILSKASQQKQQQFEPQFGGFSQAPKFPMAHGLSFLLRSYYQDKNEESLNKVLFTLDRMANSGIFDQIGGGFHRYSTDIQWLVPHFEKMLYDQALLIKAYLEAYQITKNPKYAVVVRETIEYLQRDMLNKEGGFYSAEDADSEGEEGVFYVWTPNEIKEVVGEKYASLLGEWFGVSNSGNFEGKNILTEHLDLNNFEQENKIPTGSFGSIISQAKKSLLKYRSKRERPHLDDKIMVDWNGLLISALSQASLILPEDSNTAITRKLCLKLAMGSADFILDKLTNSKGRLIKSYREGATTHLGFIEDYSFFINGLLDLYEASFEIKYLKEAFRLTEDMVKYFYDEKKGGFFFVANDQEQLIQNPKELYDGAIPSGNSMAFLAIVRVEKLTSNKEYQTVIEKTIQFFSSDLQNYPSAYPQFLQGIDFIAYGGQELVLAVEKNEEEMGEFLNAVYSRYIPRKVVIHRPKAENKDLYSLIPFIKFQDRQKNNPTFYLCENYNCKRPTGDLNQVEKLLDALP